MTDDAAEQAYIGNTLGLRILYHSTLDSTYSNTWVPSFQHLAAYKGVWRLFSGSEKVLEKPVLVHFEYVDSDPFIAIEKYKLALAEYQDNERRVRLAKWLLVCWIDHNLQFMIRDLDHPKDAWEHLGKRFHYKDMSN